MDVKDYLEKKNDLERRKERLIGKLETSKENLAKIDSRLKERGIDPSTLDDEIARLKSEHEKHIKTIGELLEKAEEVLTRIENRI
jgi:chromosome segregation ATPase